MNSSELLSSKENIQPLRCGRDASKLSAGLHAQTDADAAMLLQKQRHDYETLLRDESISDPMAVWFEYINWLEQSFPSQNQKANLNTVLVKCINKFKKCERYLNDERFVKLCLKYATMNEQTTDTFVNLYKHGIGVKCAIYYIAWAELFTMTDSFKKASQVYKRGIERLAEPLELLKEAERNFEAFLVRRMLNSGEVFTPTTEFFEIEPSRQVYNKVKPVNVGNKVVIPSIRTGENVVAGPGKLKSAVKPAAKANTAIAFYQDDGEPPADDIHPGTLKHVKSHKAMTKENIIKPGKWTNREKRDVPFAVPFTPMPFQVHADEDAEQTPKPSVQITSALKPKQVFDEFNVDYGSTPLFLSEPYDPKMRPMYCKEKVYAGGIEFQFEELRAIKYRRRMAANKAAASKPLMTPLAVPLTQIDSLRKQETSGVKTRCNQQSGVKSARRTLAVGENSEKRIVSSGRKSNFGGVVRRTLVLDQMDPSNNKPEDAPSDSFINQTIHTKEAVNEMQELWFAKPVTPPQKETQKPTFDFYVDESCLVSKESEIADAPKPQFTPPVDEQNKENAIPTNYTGMTGKSARPVRGILTLAENVPFEAIEEAEDGEEAEEETTPEPPCNTTGITETWNFTQAFSFPKIIHASTPNVRRSIFRQPAPEDLVLEKPSFENCEQSEPPLDLKTATPQQTLEEKQDHLKGAIAEQRTLGECNNKNLSIIVETSREYKSSSSGSGACSKFLPFTPGQSRTGTEAQSKRYSYSQTEESRKTPYAFKTQSTYGYEASSEASSIAHRTRTDIFKANDLLNKADEESLTTKPKENVLMETMGTSFGKIAIQQEDIDPFDVKLLDALLEQINFPGKHHLDGCNFIHSKLAPLKLNSRVTLGCDTFDIKKILGEGAYAKIFKAQSQENNEYKVFKYQKPAFPWEFYIAREIQSRCKTIKQTALFTSLEEAFFFENASVLISTPVEYGDLLTAINLYKVNQGKPMTDYLALYFTVQMLEIMETLHSFQIIHGDIKPDNFLVKKIDGKLALELIDFGRSIDMTLFPKGTSFTRVVTTDGLTCVEMQTGRRWTYQLDLYGIAGCVHCLLFGDYMKVIKKGSSWDISKTIPRYLAKTGWKQLFQTLLNVPSCDELPNLKVLRSELAEKLQAYGPQPDLLKLTNFLENR